MPQNKLISNQSGNAFLIVMLGVVLFATLAFTVSRSMRSDTTTRLTEREISLAATEILDYAQRMSRAVDRLRRRGVSESDISFDQDFVAGYAHGQPDEHKVFNSAGGNIRYIDPTLWVDQSIPDSGLGVCPKNEWVFSGNNTVPDVGQNCGSCDELILALHHVDERICVEINNRLGITNPGGEPPPESSGTPPGTLHTGKFTGNFPTAVAGIDNGAGAEETACLLVSCGASGEYTIFYHTLIAR